MSSLEDKINMYLGYQINEKYSKEMLDVIDRNTLRDLSRKLNMYCGIDIEKSTFTEVPVGSITPGKMKDKVIICFYDPKSLAIVDNADDGTVNAVLGVNRGEYAPKNKKQAILAANRLFVVTQANGVSNYDIRKMRRERKDGATALDRNSDTWGDKDKSGYDLTAAKQDLDKRLYNFTKDKRADKIKERFKKLSGYISHTLEFFINGAIPASTMVNSLEQDFKVLIDVMKTLSSYHNKDIPEYTLKDIEKKLDQIHI